jgi:hypothetical protein
LGVAVRLASLAGLGVGVTVGRCDRTQAQHGCHDLCLGEPVEGPVAQTQVEVGAGLADRSRMPGRPQFLGQHFKAHSGGSGLSGGQTGSGEHGGAGVIKVAMDNTLAPVRSPVRSTRRTVNANAAAISALPPFVERWTTSAIAAQHRA